MVETDREKFLKNYKIENKSYSIAAVWAPMVGLTVDNFGMGFALIRRGFVPLGKAPLRQPLLSFLTYTALKTIKDEIEANAASIYAELGGSAYGHLGLVLTAAEYALVSVIPYVRHLHPPPLAIPINSTQHAATRLQHDHNKSKKNF